MRRPQVVHKETNDLAQNAGEKDGPTLKHGLIIDLPDAPRSKHGEGFEEAHFLSHYCKHISREERGPDFWILNSASKASQRDLE